MLRLHEVDEGRLDPAAVEFRLDPAAVAFVTDMMVVSSAERLETLFGVLDVLWLEDKKQSRVCARD